MKYLFVLGRDSELSFQELKAFFDDFKVISRSDNVVVAECSNIDNVEMLGGTVKAAEIIAEVFNTDEAEYAMSTVYEGRKNKLLYSVESYNSPYTDFVLKYLKEWFRINQFKAQLKKNLSPSQSSGLLKEKKFVEFVLFKNYLSRTVFISNPSEFESRDINRPYTNFVESLSLRLAKILINLSGIKEGILLDPFCGTGTVLQEALLMGYDVIGTDIDDKSVDGTKKNLGWVKQNYSVIKHTHKVLKMDARNLKLKKVNLVVTEPERGPYLKKLPKLKDAKKIISEIKELYAGFLKSLNKVLVKNGKAVILVPKIKISFNKDAGFDFEALAKIHGFSVKLGPLDYFIQKSKLRRRIYVIQKI